MIIGLVVCAVAHPEGLRAQDNQKASGQENFVLNGGFENEKSIGRAPAQWWPQVNVEKIEEHARVDDKDVFKGKRSLKISGVYGVTAQVKKPEVGHTYEISAWMKAEKDRTVIRLGFNACATAKPGAEVKRSSIGEKDGRPYYHYYELPETVIGTKWQKVENKFTLTNKWLDGIVDFQVRLDTFDNTVWIDEVKMIKDKKPQ